jgi:hypothetical protein
MISPGIDALDHHCFMVVGLTVEGEVFSATRGTEGVKAAIAPTNPCLTFGGLDCADVARSHTEAIGEDSYDGHMNEY